MPPSVTVARPHRPHGVAPLLIADAAFALSVGIDLIVKPSSGAFATVDGAKFIGIVSWCTYQLRVAWRAL